MHMNPSAIDADHVLNGRRVAEGEQSSGDAAGARLKIDTGKVTSASV
jgi:hypothetical protein